MARTAGLCRARGVWTLRALDRCSGCLYSPGWSRSVPPPRSGSPCNVGVTSGMSSVACVHCGTMIDVTKADLTGRGYRCSSCSLKASLAADGGINDVTDHLTIEERRARAAVAAREMVFGAATAAFGAILFLGASGLVGAIVTCAGLGATSHGYLTRREMSGERTS